MEFSLLFLTHEDAKKSREKKYSFLYKTVIFIFFVVFGIEPRQRNSSFLGGGLPSNSCLTAI